MKRLFILFILVLISVQSYCGIRVKANGVATKSSESNWNWTDWKEVNLIVTINDDKLVIYLDEIQSFTFIKAIDNIIQTDANSSCFLAIDKEGRRCNIQIALKTVPQLYIIYNDAQITYTLGE